MATAIKRYDDQACKRFEAIESATQALAKDQQALADKQNALRDDLEKVKIAFEVAERTVATRDPASHVSTS
eukprot:14501048-Alexandrium_andersonii.AAC.1